MALSDPIQAFMQIAQAKAKNRQQAQQDAMGIGQNIAGGADAITQHVQAAKQKQLMDQLVMAMKGQGAPQQGPAMASIGGQQGSGGQPVSIPGLQGYVPPGSGPSAVPVGQQPQLKGLPQDNNGLIDSLMTQLDPNAAIKAHFAKTGSKQTSPWRVVSGMLSKAGKPLQQNEQTGDVREVPLDVQPTGRGSSSFGMVTKWDEMPPEMRALGKGVYDGDIEIEKLGFREKTQAVLAANEYARANNLPAFQTFAGAVKGGTRKAFAFGKPAQNVLSLNTALGHAKSALDAYNNVKNLDQRFLNVPLNKARAMTNDPNIIKLQTSLTALTGELATVFKGSAGTDQEIGHWIKVLSQDLTAGQAIAAIQQVNDLLNSRLQALEQMRGQGTSNRPATGPLLSPHAAQLNQQFSQLGKTSGGQKIGRFEVEVH